MALHSAEKRLTIPLFGNEDLARAIAAAGNYQLGSLETRNFPDGESYLRFLDDVESRDVDLIYTRHIPIITSYRDFLRRMQLASLKTVLSIWPPPFWPIATGQTLQIR